MTHNNCLHCNLDLQSTVLLTYIIDCNKYILTFECDFSFTTTDPTMPCGDVVNCMLHWFCLSDMCLYLCTLVFVKDGIFE